MTCDIVGTYLYQQKYSLGLSSWKEGNVLLDSMFQPRSFGGVQINPRHENANICAIRKPFFRCGAGAVLRRIFCSRLKVKF